MKISVYYCPVKIYFIYNFFMDSIDLICWVEAAKEAASARDSRAAAGGAAG